MPSIGPKKKHYKVNPPYVKKRVHNDENVVTPPNKSIRCNDGSGAVAALKDRCNTSGSRNVINDMNKVLLEMNSELGCIATAVLLLTKAVELLQSVHGNRHAVRQLVSNLINQHVAAQVDVAATPVAPPEVVPVLYDKDIFQRHQFNTAVPVPLETGRTNMKRAQKKLLDALDT